MESNPRPRSMELIGERYLAVMWDDAHESIYEGSYLRHHCPCAACKVRREKEPSRPAPTGLVLAVIPPHLVALEPVGRYAVRLRWSDGHSAGLYEMRFLRAICPCSSCGGS